MRAMGSSETLMPTRLPTPDELIFLATRDPGSAAARSLAARLNARVPCVSEGALYPAIRQRIWGIVTWGPTNLDRLLTDHGAPPQLSWLHQSGVGMEAIAAVSLPADVTVTNIKGENYYAAPVAEHVVARMLEWSKGLRRLARAQDERTWRQFNPSTLVGKTAMIIGYGTIGQAIARRLAAFEMRLLIVRRSGTAEVTARVESMDIATARHRLGEADYIALALPLTSDTRGFLGESEISRLKPDAFIVNVGRAAVIEEAALGTALREGRIGGVALDVFWREPLPSDDEVWSWPRTAITPHMSANMAGGNGDLIAGTALNTLEQILAGEVPTNRVDMAAGY